jgi:hypothetical protein
MGAMQAPEGLRGWTIPAGAAMERNPQPLQLAVTGHGSELVQGQVSAVSRRATAQDTGPRPILSTRRGL